MEALEAAAPEGAEVRQPARVMRGPYVQRVMQTGCGACLPASTPSSTLLARHGGASEETAEAESHALQRLARASPEVSACSATPAHAISLGWRQAWAARLAASMGRWAACPAMRPAAQERAEWFRDLLQLPLADVEAVLPHLTGPRSKDVRLRSPQRTHARWARAHARQCHASTAGVNMPPSATQARVFACVPARLHAAGGRKARRRAAVQCRAALATACRHPRTEPAGARPARLCAPCCQSAPRGGGGGGA